jgi:hypothetical protein
VKPYKDTRIALEKKSEEFKKSGEILYKLEKPHLNSAVGRYYYSIYIRIMHLSNLLGFKLNNNQNSENFEKNDGLHQQTIDFFNIKLERALNPDDEKEKERVDKILTSEEKKELKKLLRRLRKLCGIRNKADYNEKSVEDGDVSQLKSNLTRFEEKYDKIIKILNIEKIEVN